MADMLISKPITKAYIHLWKERKYFFDSDWNEMEIANWARETKRDNQNKNQTIVVFFCLYYSYPCIVHVLKRNEPKKKKTQENTTIEWYKKAIVWN